MQDVYPVGSRIQLGRSKATVRYVGSVDDQTGVWVGLEWDDAGRGKHDGSHKGRRYFDCRSGEASGSFVRAAKLAEMATAANSLPEAIKARYRAGGVADDMHISTAGRRRLAVTLVGQDKVEARQAALQSLPQASVVDSAVYSVVSCSPFPTL